LFGVYPRPNIPHMKRNIRALTAFLLLLVHFTRAQSLSGTVIDSAGGQPIQGAVVYLPELKLGATTDSKGSFIMNSIPNGTYEMEVQILGYATLNQKVTIKNNEPCTCNCKMCISSFSTSEVIITALGNITNTQRSPVPVTIISHQTLLENTSSTVIDAIALQPGISMTTEGVGTTKPEINGLGFNRVLVLLDGERQEDFEWGDDHGILIDPYAVHNVEIIRGPASLQYGASAEAGVISFKSEPFAESGTVQGSLLSEYQTNNGLIGNSEDIGGNTNGLVWNIRASNEEAHDYSNSKDGYVWGSAWKQENARLTLGVNKSWGYSRLSVSALYRRIQVPTGNRDSASGKFLFNVPLSTGQIYPTRANFLAYDPTAASDKILEEYQTWWQTSINAGKGKIGIDIGYTESVHYDIDTGSVGRANFDVHDIPYSLKYQVTGEKTGIQLTTGINGTYEFESNLARAPAPYIANYEIPNYTDFQSGAYAILQKDFKRLTLSGGIRYDWSNFIGQAMYLTNPNTQEQAQASATTPGAVLQFNGFNNTYTGGSGSIGASYQLPGTGYVKLNLAKSYRAPAINELTSNGLNIGSNAFQLGNINLKAEEGYQADLAFGNNGKNVSFEVDGFYNYINNFIFADRLSAKSGGDSILLGFPAYQFLSNVAIIAGVSGYFNIHPADTKWLELDNGFTYIYSYLPNQTDSTRHIPWTPAPRLTSELKIKFTDRGNAVLKGAYIKFGLAKYWAQNNIYSALYTELPSAPYTLYNAGIGTNFVNPATKRVICSLFINCTNLTDVAYADHLNLAQYFLAYNGRGVTVTQQNQGVYNMGRNIGIKLIFPIGGHKASEVKS